MSTTNITNSVSPPAKQITLSIEQYLDLEATSAVRHEYIRGCVFAMVGASDAHNKIAGNIFSLFHACLKGTKCSVYISDMKVKVEAANSFYYPDVMVTCESFDALAVFKTKPVVIVEVLSPSTADTDRREKLTTYGLIPTLKEYLIVHQDRRRVELYRKDNEGIWTTPTCEDKVTLTSLPDSELLLQLDDIYSGVIP